MCCNIELSLILPCQWCCCFCVITSKFALEFLCILVCLFAMCLVKDHYTTLVMHLSTGLMYDINFFSFCVITQTFVDEAFLRTFISISIYCHWLLVQAPSKLVVNPVSK